MGTISVSLPADGTTADVADVNTPITTIVNAINGNLDNSNIATNAAIASSKLATGIPASMLAIPYKFSVYRNAAWTAGVNAWAKVQFDTTSFDTGSNYNNSTNYRFTAPIAGFYNFAACVTTLGNNNGAQLVLSLYKNGVEDRRLDEVNNVYSTSGTKEESLAGSSGLMQLSANDYIEVWSYQNGGTGSTGSVLTWFTGQLISST